MADFAKLLDAISSAANARGYTFDASRAVVTLEIVDKLGSTQGQTLALSHLLAGKDESALAESIVNDAAAHFEVVDKADVKAVMEENIGLRAQVAALTARLSDAP